MMSEPVVLDRLASVDATVRLVAHIVAIVDFFDGP